MKSAINAFLKKVAGIELGYECKQCGKPAYLRHGNLHRSCKHTGTVIAKMDAVVSNKNFTAAT